MLKLSFGLTCLCAIAVLCANTWAQSAGGAKPSVTQSGFRQNSLAFVPNRGQHPGAELYSAQGAGYEVTLEGKRVVVTLPARQPIPRRGERLDLAPAADAASLGINLLGANPGATVSARRVLAQKSSFFPTGDPKTWITGLPSYGRVDYADVYKGVNLDFYGQEGRLEYDFTLAAGTNSNQVRMGLEGVGLAEIDKQGDLVLHIDGSADGQLRLLKPVAYQLGADGNQKQNVEANYRIARNSDGGKVVEFALGKYDPSRPLVIDPVLAYGEYLVNSTTYLGALTADAQGNVYVSGYNSGGFDIEKFDPNGNALLNVSLGTSTIYPNWIAVDSSSNMYVTGIAYTGLPTTSNAYQRTAPGSAQPFLSVLKANGSALSYSTYFGGSSGSDIGYSVAVDGTGKAYITGGAYSSDFPTTSGAYQAAPSGGSQYFGFVAKFDPTLSGNASLIYSTALTGSYTEYAIAVDGSGNAYVTGAGYPGTSTTSGAVSYNGEYISNYQVDVTKLNSTGTGLVYWADIGPGSGDGITVDGSGNTYVTGTVTGGDYPTTSGAYQTTYAGGFATNLSADGTTLLYSTFLNGPSGYNGANVIPTTVAIVPGCSSACNAYITGWTTGTDWPLTDPIQDFGNSSGAAFVTELAGNGASAVFSSFLSGVNGSVPEAFDSYDYGESPFISVDSAGNMYIGVDVTGSDFPTTITSGNSPYAYIAKIAPTSTSLAFAVPNSVNFPEDQVVNSPSSLYGTVQPVELRNLGGVPITLQMPFIFSTPQFSETDNCPATLPAGGVCTLNVSFTPTNSGTTNGTLTINSNAPNSPTTVSLSAGGVDGGILTVSSFNLSFGDQIVATSSAAQTLTITNIGDQPDPYLQGYVYSLSADYTAVTNCPSSLGAGQSCQVSVSFTPTQVGSRVGTVFAGYDPSLGYLTVSASGTGVPSTGDGTIAISGGALNFGTQLQGAVSGSQTIYLFNTGTAPVTITSAEATTTGQSGSSDFQVTSEYCYGVGSLPAELLPENDCYIAVTFTPSTSTSETGTLTITDSTSASPHTVALSGTGVASAQTLISVPANYVFPAQPVGVTSATETFYMYDTGTAPFTVDRVLVTGDFQITNSNCPDLTLNPSNPEDDYADSYDYYCYVSLTFTPTTTGSLTGTLSFVDAATGSPQVVNLMGTGVTPTGSLVPEPDSLVFEAQPNGTTSAYQQIYIYNTGNSPVQLNSLTSTGDFAIESQNCGALPTTMSPGYDCYINVSYTPTQASGNESGSVVAGSTAGNLTIPLSGTAEAATQAIGISPTTFNFGTVQQYTTLGYTNSPSYYYVYVRNTGTEAVTFSAAPGISGTNAGDFAIAANYCGASGATLAPGTNCAIGFNFTPSTTSSETATLTLTDSAGTGTQTMTLNGSGSATLPNVYLEPGTMAFPPQPVGTTSTVNSLYAVFFENNESNTLGVTSAAITAGTSDFSIPSGYDYCSGQTVGTGSDCVVYLMFGPSSSGNRTGTLTFTDQNNTKYTVSLSGYAPAGVNSATLDPLALDFLSQSVNATQGNGSQSNQSLTLTNTGNRSFTVGTLTGTDTVVGTSASGDFSTASPYGYDGCSGQTITAGGSCTVNVIFTPASAGSKSGSITIPVTYIDNTTANFTATLSGNAVNEQDSAALSPTNMVFAQEVAANPNNTLGGYTFTLTNTSNLELNVGTLTGTDTIIGASSTGDFVAATKTLFGVQVPGYDGCSGTTLAAGGTCYVYVYFAPGTTGAKSGSITFPVTYTDGTKGSFTATLSGSSIAAANSINVSPTSAQFESEVVATTDPGNTAPITVENTGNIPITFGTATVTTNFTKSGDNCSSTTVQAGNSCTITVQFTPKGSTTGTETGTLTINDSVTGSPQTVSLSGQAIAANTQFALSQTTAAFGSVAVSTTSNPQVVYVINQGTASTISIQSTLLNGSQDSNFSESDTCGGSSGTTLAARSTCAITVACKPGPSNKGSLGASVKVTPTTGSALTLSMTCTGVTAEPEATVFPTSISFGNQTESTTSAAQYFSVTNSGSAALSVASVKSNDSPEFAISSDGCSGQSVPVGSNCTVALTFTPSAGGSRGSTITITDNNGGTANSTQTVTVGGTGTGGQTITFGPLPNVTYGVSPITLTATASSGLPVSYTVTGPAMVSGSTLTITGAGSVTVTANQAGNSNFGAASPVMQSFTVAQAPLTITANSTSISYGQTIPSFSYTPSGFVNGDTAAVLSGTPSESTSATSSSAPGNYAIVITQGSLAAANYAFTFVNGTLTIGTASQSITFGPLSNQTYGVSPITLTAIASSGLAVNYSVTGPAMVSGSTLTITGAGNVTVTAMQGGNADYSAAPNMQQSFMVSKALLTITANNANSSYGQAIPTFSYTPSGFVNSDTAAVLSGTPSESTSATSSSAPGNYTITIAQGSLAAANYSFTFVNGTLTIGKASQSITFGPLSNQTYGVSPITLTATASSGLAVNYTVTGPASVTGSTLTITGAGNVTVTANQAGNADYALATSVQQSFTVAKAPLTITANNASIDYGQAIPSFSYTPSGFVNGDTAAVLSGTPSETTTATSSSAPGTYPITITQGTLTAANYAFNFVNGTLTINTPTTQTIIFTPAAGTYNSSQEVSISDSATGATIYYTTNGTTPTTNSTVFNSSNPISVDVSTTIRAIGVLNGSKSSMVTAAYKLEPVTPVLSLKSGSYLTPQQVTISDATPNAAIWYTTDNTTPVPGAGTATEYTSGTLIPINENTTLKAVAAITGWTTSAVASGVYTLKVATPTFSLKSGSYLTPQQVSISDTASNATIWYTTDNSTPVPGEGTAVQFNSTPIAVNENTTIKAVAAVTGWTTSSAASGVYTLKVATPTFSLKSGSYPTPQQVTISDTASNATIWYTTDDSTPIPGEGTATQYTGGALIPINQNTTVKAVAAVSGWTNSSAASGVYTLKVATPTFSPSMGTYTTTESVSISDTTPNATIWYTTDDSTPVPGEGTAVQYSGTPIAISQTTTLKAVAAVSGWTNSNAASGVYTLKVPTPTFGPVAGTYTTAQSVTINDSNSNAVIWYTTDGSTPVAGGGGTTQQFMSGIPISVTSTKTVRAIAAITGWTTSTAASATYTIR